MTNPIGYESLADDAPMPEPPESSDPTTCRWCKESICSTNDPGDGFAGECLGCDATVEQDRHNSDEYHWTPTKRTVVACAQQLIRPNTWRHIPADDLADVLDILAERVREADLAALKAAREQIDANRARTGAA